jgi:hypothetical protein
MVGCATGAAISEANYSVGEIKQVIQSIVGEFRTQSQNQRTIYSKYFGTKKDKDFDEKKSKKRLYAVVTILGDRRPYDIDVEVIVEAKVGSGYEESGSDQIKAQEIADEIVRRLHEGIENRNVIDDFRAF